MSKLVEGSKEFHVQGCGGTMFTLSSAGEITINWEVVEASSKLNPMCFNKHRYITVILTAKALMRLKP